MSTLLFDIALVKRFTDSSELAVEDIDGVDVVIVYNQADSTVYKIPFSSLAEYVNANGVVSVAGKTGVVTLVKGDVGLGNVDNTSDLNKPISTATQTALNGKANTSHAHAISDVTGLQTALDAKAAKSSGTWTPSVTVNVGPTKGASATYSGTWSKLDNRALVDFNINLNSSDVVAVGDRFTITNMPKSVLETFIMSGGTAMLYSSWGSGTNAYFHVGVASSSSGYIECIYVSGSPTYNSTIKGQVQYRTSA